MTLPDLVVGVKSGELLLRFSSGDSNRATINIPQFTMFYRTKENALPKRLAVEAKAFTEDFQLTLIPHHQFLGRWIDRYLTAESRKLHTMLWEL